MAGFAVRRTLQGAWNRRGPLAWSLWPLSLMYRALWLARLALYRLQILRAHKVPVPVIVVGNVVAGGAGKTPMVIALVEHLQSIGLRPGVVSRGYGRRSDACRLVAVDATAAQVGDEPLLIRRRTGAPVAVARSRIAAAQALLARHPDLDLLVCDDGLQHLALQRDIEICLFDARGVGNGFLLPAGPLREPWPRDADLMVQASDRPADLAGHRVRRALADHAVRADGSRVALSALAAHGAPAATRLLAVAGTAQPEAFFAMLRERGLTLARTMALPDHADFDAAQWHADNGTTIICTEKDAVKLWHQRPDALAVPLVVTLDAPFWSALLQLLRTRGTPQLRAKLSSGNGHTPT